MTPRAGTAGADAPEAASASAGACRACAAPLAADQRWCVACGARQAGADARTLLFGPPAPPSPVMTGRLGTYSEPDRPLLDTGRRRRAALPVALASLVGLVVVTGTGVPASLAGSSQPPFTVVLPAQVAQQVAQAPPAAATTPPVAEIPYEEPSVEPPLEEPLAEAPVEEAQAPAEQTTTEETAPPAEAPAESSPIKHVFVIALGAADLTALAGDETTAPYFAGTLVKSGTLLSDYVSVARGGLADRIALISGQGPTRQTLDACTTYGDVRPADPLPDGQTGGDGCVYGYETGHVGDQLRALERTWKAYVEPAAGASASTARRPAARAAAACEADAESSRRNPFLWFRGTFEADDCDTRMAPLTQLGRDLRAAETTPALSWIASDAQQSAADADRFLARVVPAIQNSLAYANGGLIVIVGDQPPPAAPPVPTAPPTPTAPPAATTPAPPPPAPTPPAATPDPAPPAAPETPAPTPTPPTQTTPVEPPPTTTTPAEPPTQTTPQGPPPTTTTPTPLARASADTDADAAADAPTEPTPGPTTYPNVGDVAAAGGGVPVGALLISSFTPSGRVETIPANAFTLLRTFEQIFGVDPLGYAAADGVEPLPERLFSVRP